MCLLFLNKRLFCNLINSLYHKSKCNTRRMLCVVSSVSSNGNDVPFKVKGRFASNEQKRLIIEFVTESDLTKIDWNLLRKSVLCINRGYINEKNIDGRILDTCSQQKRLDLAKSYIKYLKENGLSKLNITLELIYIRACYTSRDQLTDEDQNEIQAICQSQIKKKLYLMNSIILEGIVMGLCCTPLWRDSINYLKALPHENDKITSNTFICIILRAFEDAEIDLGWTMTQQLYNLHNLLPLVIFASWFNLCETNLNYKYQRALTFLKDNECIVNENMAKLIQEKFKLAGNQVTDTIISYNGKCKTCNETLNPVEVTDSEFKLLQGRFMSHVMVGKNIFNNSSPKELQNFKKFIENTGPYDVVVDGLNLAYAYRGKIANNSLTMIVMKHFIEQKLNVLLIGRNHLVKMLGKDFEFIKNNAHLFFTDDLSKDDPFVLYATMYSGIGTKILTRDLMRGHKILLADAKIKSIFQKWLQKHRLRLKLNGPNYFKIKDPLTYLQLTQESAKGIWHLPYEENKEPGTWSKPDVSPDGWICIKPVD